MTINEIESELSTVLNSRRYQHTLGVSYTAASLAMCYGCNIEKARIAGLLHDCAKCLSDTELLQTAREHELPISESEEADPYLLHGKVGAYFAENKYGITDPDILSAILFHTTGRPNMTLLEEIIFVADFIEPGRRGTPNLAKVRQDAFIDLDKAALGEIMTTLEFLYSRGREIDTTTLETRDYYQHLIYGKE